MYIIIDTYDYESVWQCLNEQTLKYCIEELNEDEGIDKDSIRIFKCNKYCEDIPLEILVNFIKIKIEYPNIDFSEIEFEDVLLGEK